MKDENENNVMAAKGGEILAINYCSTGLDIKAYENGSLCVKVSTEYTKAQETF